MSQAPNVSQRESPVLDIFCSRWGDRWVVMISPVWTPPLLETFFDRHGEALADVLDFDDLDRYMSSRDASYEKRVSTLGGVQLEAHGASAEVLAEWLLTAFSSGVRRPATPSSAP